MVDIFMSVVLNSATIFLTFRHLSEENQNTTMIPNPQCSSSPFLSIIALYPVVLSAFSSTMERLTGSPDPTHQRRRAKIRGLPLAPVSCFMPPRNFLVYVQKVLQVNHIYQLHLLDVHSGILMVLLNYT